MTTTRTRRPTARTLVRAAGATLLAAGVLATAGLTAAPAGADEPAKVTICHATSSTSNPYVQITVNTSSLDGKGKNDHTSHTGGLFDFTDPAANEGWGDIIPAAPGVADPVNDDAAGQAILANGCNGPEQGSCPDGSDPVEGGCPTEETCPGGEAAVGGECPDGDEVVCETDATLSADDPACGEGEEPVCKTDPTLSADDPACGADEQTEPCAFDAALEADDPACVEAEQVPAGPTEDGDGPAEGSGIEVEGVVIPAAAPAAPTLPVTGTGTGIMAAAAVGLIALGAGCLLAERRTVAQV